MSLSLLFAGETESEERRGKRRVAETSDLYKWTTAGFGLSRVRFGWAVSRGVEVNWA